MEDPDEFIKLARFTLGASGGKFVEYSEFLREFKKDNPKRDFEREAWEAGYNDGLDALSNYDAFEISGNSVRRVDTAAHIASAIAGSRPKRKRPARRPANQQYRPQQTYGNHQYSRAGPSRQVPARYNNTRFESRGISTGYKQQQSSRSQWPKASTYQRPATNGYNNQTSRQNGYSNNQRNYDDSYNTKNNYHDDRGYDNYDQRNGYSNDRGYDNYDQGNGYSNDRGYDDYNTKNNYHDDRGYDNYDQGNGYSNDRDYDNYDQGNGYNQEESYFEESYQRPRSNNYNEDFEEPKQSSQSNNYKEEEPYFEEPKQSSQSNNNGKKEEDLYDDWLSSPQTKVKEEPVSQTLTPQQPTTSATNVVGPKYDDRLQEDVIAKIGNLIFELIQDLHKQGSQALTKQGDKRFLKSDVLLAAIKKHKLDSGLTLGKLRCFLALFFTDSFHVTSGGSNSVSILSKSEAPKNKIACRLSPKEIPQQTLQLNVDYLCQMLGADSKDNILLVYLSPVAWKEDYTKLLMELRHYASVISFLKPLDFIFKSDRALYYDEESRKFYRCIVLSAGEDQGTVKIFLPDEFQKYSVKMTDLYKMPARFRQYQDMAFTLMIGNQGQTAKLPSIVETLKKCAAKNYVMNIKLEEYREFADGLNFYAGHYQNIAKG
ncbi:hypothetical protein M3Y97_00044800 [Aphelenchoides bicaudatus]|nr:hypothetical protein M3Y97_00044800 [Aphelenchoides bicaudatus]